MYGREAICAHLLEDVPFSDDEDDESNEVCLIDSQTDWMESLMDTRTESRTQAHENSATSNYSKRYFKLVLLSSSFNHSSHAHF